MLVTELYDGQGFGNQLWSYVFTRVLSLDKNVDFGIQCPERFKGIGFLDLDMGQKVIGGSGPAGGPPTELPNGIKYYYSERVITHPELDVDIRTLDPGFQEIVDNTKVEGIFQAEDYILHRKEDIRSWLTYEPKQLDIDFTDDDLCVINFRGGEYRGNPKIFLRRKYWVDAIAHVRSVNPHAKFVVITDDPSAARKFFPKFPIRHYGIHGDYQAINSAKYLILSNSSFAFFPAWLNSRVRICLAPKYWAAHNESDGYWCCSYNIVRDWTYLDRDGSLQNFDECTQEHERFQDRYSNMYAQKRIIGACVIVSSFNNDLSWLPRYSDDYVIFEQGRGSGLPPQILPSKVRYVTNSGSNLRDYFTYIIENYESLPEVMFLIKGNVFPRHVRQHVFDNYVTSSTPTSITDLEMHEPHFPLGFFDKDGMYNEFNSDWFINANVPRKYFNSLNSLFYYFDPKHKPRIYSRFSIGAQYLTTRNEIKKLTKSTYLKLREIVSHGGQASGYTLESLLVERALNRLWLSDAITIREPLNPRLPVSGDIEGAHSLRRRILLTIHTVFSCLSRLMRFHKLMWKALVNRLKLLRNCLALS